ncbi:MAG: AmmeMemoRadiSam system protein B [Chloroflexi bacterium]|nr:AmmeMemoRadiSam system protein B [Chloroflexota bacterium]
MSDDLLFPKVRPVETHWVEHQGQPVLLVRDRSGLTDRSLLVPPMLALLLALCDGTRDRRALGAAFQLRTGVTLTPTELDQLLAELDGALLLESPRLAAVRAQALAAFRAEPFREPALAGSVYPADAAQLRRQLAAFGARTPPVRLERPAGAVRGVVSPHIDFQRGGPIYAQLWQPLAEAVRSAEVIVVLGTDHAGGPGQITPTRQRYATPFGVLPTDHEVVDAMAAAIGEDDAFAEELHHKNEHSIELALVWLHSLLDGATPALVPVLCGSFHPFTQGEADAAADRRLAAVVGALVEATRDRRTLVVAAADLAHVGPAFGDPEPLSPADRTALQSADAALLGAICHGDAADFIGQLRQERDRRKVCGLPPIYLALRFLGKATGAITGYDHCPADADGGSLVSIAGAVLW